MGLFDRLLRSTLKADGGGPGPRVRNVEATFSSGNQSLEVKGESFYQQNLQRVVKEIGREAPAILRPEPENPYDANAVSVWMGGVQVGHLGRQDAAIYQRAIQRLMQETGMPVAVSACIFGGEPGKETLGVWLYHDPADFGLPGPSNGGRSAAATRTGASLAGTSWQESLSEAKPADVV